MVVLSMITILAALLCPALERAMQISENTNCVSNIKQISAAMSMYLNENQGYLPKHDFGYSGTPKYMKWQDALYTTMTGYTGEYNNYYLESGTPKSIFACPTQVGSETANAYQHYGFNEYSSGKMARKIRDPSLRLLVMDSNKANSPGVNNVPINWGLRHINETANTLFADYHISTLGEDEIPTSAWNKDFWGQNLD